MLAKRNLKRNDKKSGRKKPHANDYDNTEDLPAPDSEVLNQQDNPSIPHTPVNVTPKTPVKPISNEKTPVSKRKLKYSSPQQTGKQLRFAEDEYDILVISPVSESACPLQMTKRKVSIDTQHAGKTPWVSDLTAEHKLMLTEQLMVMF